MKIVQVFAKNKKYFKNSAITYLNLDCDKDLRKSKDQN